MKSKSMPVVVAASLLVLQTLLAFLHFAIYETVAVAFGFSNGWLRLIFILASFTFVSASFLSHWVRSRAVDWYYRFAAYWFGLAHFLFGGVVIFLAVGYSLYSANYYISPAWIAGVSLGAMFLLHLYGTWNSGRARVTKMEVALPNLPDAWRGKKVLFMSDLHLGSVRQEGFARKIARRIKELAPEAVFIGGDVFDGGAADPARLVAPLKAVISGIPQGAYFITGNHEFYVRDVHAAIGAIRDLGIRVLENEKVDIEGLAVIGVDYPSTFKKEDFQKILQGLSIDRHHASILLKHEPSNVDVARDAGISLGLYGHTHHGQIFPLGFFTKRIYKGLDYGLKRLGSLFVYTSSGAGTWGPPLRLGTRSEVVLITLK